MLTTWSAVSTLDRMFDDVMGSAHGTATSSRTFDPAIDVRSSGTEVVVVCDVPGVKQEDLLVTIENHVLTLEGTRKLQTDAGEYVVVGRPYGAFRRSFTLPDSLDESGLEANLADGVLTIRIPKRASAKPRKIQVAVRSNAKPREE